MAVTLHGRGAQIQLRNLRWMYGSIRPYEEQLFSQRLSFILPRKPGGWIRSFPLSCSETRTSNGTDEPSDFKAETNVEFYAHAQQEIV